MSELLFKFEGECRIEQGFSLLNNKPAVPVNIQNCNSNPIMNFATDFKILERPSPTIPTFKDEISTNKPLSFHERFCNYLKTRARIFGNTPVQYTKSYKRLKTYRNHCKLKSKMKKEIASLGTLHEKDNRPFGKVYLEGKEMYGLLDSGASLSVLGRNALPFLDSIKRPFMKLSSTVSTSDGTSHPILGFVELLASYKDIQKPHTFYVVPSLSRDLYLGFDFWKSFGIAPELHHVEVNAIDCPDITPEKPESKEHSLTEEQRFRLEKVKALFPSSIEFGLGQTNLLTHKIDTGDAEPIKARHYPVSPKVQALMFEELDRMLKLGVIEESESPWNSPVVLVRKPGKNRLCLDSRRLNSVTKKMAYGLPNINGLLSRLEDTYYISCIDLKDAFYQIKLDDESKEKTAFTVPGRPQYQFVVMPFGLCNAAQRLCQLMDRVFPTQLRSNVSVYLDDLLVVSASFDEHMTLLTTVAQSLQRAGLTVNLLKSRFCYQEVKYLGHIVGQGTLRPDEEKVTSITNFPVPTSVRQMRRFIGMCGYYGKFVENYSTICSPLTDTIKRNGKFVMTPEALQAFDVLKSALVSAPVLVHPDFRRPFTIHCDASMYGIGACLMQKDENGNDKAICYFSKKLSKAQKNYSVTELECLAVVLAVEKFRPYVELQEFSVITDHSALKWLMGQKDLSGRLARWSLRLQRYDFDIQHRKGRFNVVPDALSREADISEISLNCALIDLDSPEFKSEEYTHLISTVLENGDHFPDLKTSDGYVYKRTRPRNGVDDEIDLWKLWVPSQLTSDLIRSVHFSDDTFHLGTSKTLNKIKQLYYWPKMNNQIYHFVSGCDKCKEIKTSNKILRGKMGKNFEASRPFQHIYIDYLGPYPRTRRGNSYILVILDHLTKFPIFVPIRQATAALTIEILEKQVFSIFNVPETLLSDNGSQFLSQIFQNFLASFGVRHLTTPIYSPQANASERLNRSIIQGIRMHLDSDHTKWDESLTKIAFALRSNVQDSIGVSPHYALFGSNKICHGSSYALLKKLDCLSDPDIRVDDVSKVQKIHEDIADKIRQAHEKFEKSYNLRTRKIKFVKGQEVFRRLFHQSDLSKSFNAKFAPKFSKCKVKEILGNNRLLLSDLKGHPLGVYHTKDVKT